MNSKAIIAILVISVVGFLLGWLVFGILLMGYYSSHMMSYNGLMKDPPVVWMIFLSNLCWAVLLVYVFHSLASIKTIGKGIVAGLIIAFLISLSFDLFMYSSMNLYVGGAVLVVDVLANALMGAVMGGVAGWILGMGKANT
jgi:hypothetical protein